MIDCRMFCCVAVLLSAACCPAAEQAAAEARPDRDRKMKTLGGRQFWGDVEFFHAWRIQQNILTGHHRLLDGDDRRYESGTLEACREKLAKIKTAQKLPPMKGKAAIVIHGIVRSSKSFGKMRAALQKAGYVVFGFDYPSTRVEISQSADYLHRAISSLDGIEEINFVVHSMGGLVVRSYLKDHRDKRIKRMVMLGVPNRGAKMADRLSRNFLYKAIYGPAGQQLVSGDASFVSGLPTPDFEFAIVAGARGHEKGYNPLIPGDDDGTVSLDSAQLPGAADFMTVRCLHSFLMKSDDVIAATSRFLSGGSLSADGKRSPLPREEPLVAPKP